MTLTMTFMGPFTGHRFHVSYEWWFKTGAILCALGSVGIAIASGPGPWGIAIPSLVITGVGAGYLLTPSFQTFSATNAGRDGVGIATYNLLRLSSFAVGGIVGAAAVDGGAPWVAFVSAAVACLLMLTRRFPAPVQQRQAVPIEAEVS